MSDRSDVLYELDVLTERLNAMTSMGSQIAGDVPDAVMRAYFATMNEMAEQLGTALTRLHALEGLPMRDERGSV